MWFDSFTPKPPTAGFLWIVGQVGFEHALKAQLSKLHPSLRFAYSRQGFVSFKASEALPLDLVVRSPLARAWSVSLGRIDAKDNQAAVERVRQLASEQRVKRLHVFSRDDFPVDESPAPEVLFAEALRVESLLSDVAPIGEAQAGELVLDVCVVQADEWWVGVHQHTPLHSRHPGGRPRLVLPATAPSRAYLKAEEAIDWAQLPIRAGQWAVELGSAPGGAVHALLERGLHVVGVDPGAMDSTILEHARYRHVAEPVAELDESSWPKQCDWLFVDLNIAPIKSLHAIERALPFLKQRLKAMVITFKIHGESQIGDVTQYEKRLRSFGFAKVRARQLGFNRRELCVVAERS